MRLLTWNVNGIKTLLQYHPWRDCKTYEGIMEHLGADIICIQETKITRAQMDKSMACMKNFETFVSFFSRQVKGIHGTAIFTKTATTMPIKAEEGIGNCLLPSTLAEEDRIGGYALGSDVDLAYAEMKDLDVEGRTTVCDFGLFVLINLYCPNETNEERLVFKNYFNALVDRRVRNLIKAGRQVIVVGDLNICASNLDTAEPMQRAKEQGLEEFTDHPPRKWLKAFTGPGGPMIDITRRYHPDRRSMFTCWNTKIDARPANYGTRLDYILVTPGLLPWIRFSDIQASVHGSDHCPVYVDFHDEIEIEGRGKVKLWDEMNPGRSADSAPPPPPAFAARNLKEFSSAQKLLASFFSKPMASSAGSVGAAAGPSSSAPAAKVETKASNSTTRSSTPKSPKPLKTETIEPASVRPKLDKSQSSETSQTRWKGKAKETSAVDKNGSPSAQTSISSFFQKPAKEEKPKLKKKTSNIKASGATSAPSVPVSSSSSSQRQASKAPSEEGDVIIIEDEHDENQNTLQSDRLDVVTNSNGAIGKVLAAAQAHDDMLASLEGDDEYEATAASNSDAASAWSNIFATKAAPICDGHGEPTKLWTVNKTGINKGRRFYLCQRPVGPGYDKGQKKTNVNPEFRCNFFQWETNVKRPAGISLDGWSQSKKSKTS